MKFQCVKLKGNYMIVKLEGAFLVAQTIKKAYLNKRLLKLLFETE